MEKQGSQLEFISRINRDGSAVEPVIDPEKLHQDHFYLRPLSLTLETYIATGINCYVVKIKNDANE